MSGFASLGVAPARVAVLAARGIATPFAVQQAVVPDACRGLDVVVQARTGRGKTLAYGLPLVERLAVHPAVAAGAPPPRGLVLVPTRELAGQVADDLRELLATAGLDVLVVHGGVDPGAQVEALRRGPAVVVATPGRLDELVGRGDCVLSSVEVLVLDEVDQLVDLGFLLVVEAILAHVPAGAQHLFLSATLDDAVDALVAWRAPRAVRHLVDLDVPADDVDEHLWFVPHWHRRAVLRRLAGGPTRTIVFSRTRHGARRVAEALEADGVPNVVLHGDLAAPVRAEHTAAFRDGRARVLVATDVAARGLQFDDVPLVVHAEPPNDAAAYLHRSGRTARAGERGVVVTLCMPDQEHRLAKLRAAGALAADPVAVTPDDPRIDVVLGEASARAANC